MLRSALAGSGVNLNATLNFPNIDRTFYISVNFGATFEFVRQHCRFESPANTAARRKVGHLHYFTKETAIATLVDCGYNTIDQAYTPSRLELPNQTRSSKFMKLPRRYYVTRSTLTSTCAFSEYSLLLLAA
jgi:hypothetical protein